LKSSKQLDSQLINYFVPVFAPFIKNAFEKKRGLFTENEFDVSYKSRVINNSLKTEKDMYASAAPPTYGSSENLAVVASEPTVSINVMDPTHAMITLRTFEPDVDRVTIKNAYIELDALYAAVAKVKEQQAKAIRCEANSILAQQGAMDERLKVIGAKKNGAKKNARKS
jgi:hypothetical protein